MKIQAIGGCCKKSFANYEAVCTAVKELNLDVTVEHITDMNQIVSMGILSTPALVINDKIVSSGRLLKVQQAKEYITKNQ